MRIPRRLMAVASFVLTTTVHAKTHDVPAQYPTIQDAVLACSEGDTVLVAPGKYKWPGNVSLYVLTDRLHLLSAAGPESTILDCEGNGRAMDFHSRGGVLRGFTIMRGHASRGAGVNIGRSGVRVESCVFIGNRSETIGGAILAATDVTIAGCTIAGNAAAQSGGGIFVGGSATIMGTIVRENCAPEGSDVFVTWAPETARYLHSAIEESGLGGPGNHTFVGAQITEDPLFCDSMTCAAPTLTGDPRLTRLSPCLPENNDVGRLIGALSAGCTGACCFGDGRCVSLGTADCQAADGQPVVTIDDCLAECLAPVESWANVATGTLADPERGMGVAWGDYDADGDPDLYVASHLTPNHLMRNDGVDGFADVSGLLANDLAAGRSPLWVDYDNDRDLDLFLPKRQEPNMLYRNDGNDVFVNVAEGSIASSATGLGAAWFDLDLDGDLDVYLSNYQASNQLLRNDRDGVFADVTTSPLEHPVVGTGLAAGDYDADGDVDLFVVGFAESNRLFRNDTGAFVDVTSPPIDMFTASESAAWADYDDDGDLDLYVTIFNRRNKMFRNDEGAFVDVTVPPLETTLRTYGFAWADYDNDGDLDLHGGGNQEGRLVRNEGPSGFSDVTTGPLINHGECRGVAWADFDLDGDLDIYTASQLERNLLIRNDQRTGNHWLHVDLEGHVSNAYGVGSRIVLVVDGRSQMREVAITSGYGSQNSVTTEFGLGKSTRIDSVMVHWPSGTVDRITEIAVDQRVRIREGTGLVHTPASAAPAPLLTSLSAQPNPLEVSTTLTFTILKRGPIRVRVFDVAGRQVRLLLDESEAPIGRRTITWNANDADSNPVASGVYFCEVMVGAHSSTERLVVTR